MANTFTYLDVETANRYRRSICQVGVVAVDDGRIADQWATLVDLGEEFDPWCSKIHGITGETVQGMRTFGAIWPELRNRLGNSTVISHSSFDRTAINQAAEWHQIEDHRDLVWEDSVRIARQAWPGLAGGYGLKNLCEVLEIEFKHHDALQDALAGVQVVLQASATTGMDVARFQAERPSQSAKRRVGREGNPEGHCTARYASSRVLWRRFAANARTVPRPLGAAWQKRLIPRRRCLSWVTVLRTS